MKLRNWLWHVLTFLALSTPPVTSPTQSNNLENYKYIEIYYDLENLTKTLKLSLSHSKLRGNSISLQQDRYNSGLNFGGLTV